LSDGSADRISVARRPPPRADSESIAVTDSGTNADAEPRAGTARGRDLAGAVLHADSADTVSDAGAIDYTERRSRRLRFSGAAADGFANTRTVADAVTIANPHAVAK